jgi:hypothetical protein
MGGPLEDQEREVRAVLGGLLRAGGCVRMQRWSRSLFSQRGLEGKWTEHRWWQREKKKLTSQQKRV